MTKKIISRVLFFLITVVSLTAIGTFFLFPETKVSGQQDRGWTVWVKASPCSGRHDWVSVAKENPALGGGGGSWMTADQVLIGGGMLRCVRANNICTFAQAEAEREIVRASSRFSDYCCREYSVWENTQTDKRSVVQGKFGNAGFGWRFVKGDLCCEEAEELAGIPGACSGSTGGKSGYIGCFKDPNNPFDLDGFLERSRSNTPQRCIATCHAKGFKYAGVQYGESCLCGNSYGKFGEASNCNMKCTGDSSKICGGINSNSVYGTGVGSNDSTAATDLSGTWYAVVNDTSGKWEYTMVLNRESPGKWTGTLAITLDGGSSSTTEVAVESLSSGRISYVWRPGRPNAQQFEGTHTKDRISVAGFGGQLLFTRR